MREYYEINEAVALLDCKLGDLLHLGATKKITLSTYIRYDQIYEAKGTEAANGATYWYKEDDEIPELLKPVHANVYLTVRSI